MENLYVVGTTKEILTINDLKNAEIETTDNEDIAKICNNKYSIYVEDGEDVNGDKQYKYVSTKLV